MRLEEKQFNKRVAKISNLPYNVFIETVFGCNLHCEMCPVPKGITNRKKTIMQFSTFKEIIDQLSDRQRYIGLNQLGEPLLNKNIIEFIKYAKMNNHKTHLTTNATLLNKNLSEDLLNAGLDSITFSIDGIDKKTYETIRIGANFEDTIENVKYFCYMNNKLKCCRTQVDCIVSDLTEKQMPKIKLFWKDIAPVNFIPLDNWTNQLELPVIFGKKRTPNNVSLKRYPCHLLWTSIAISAEGRVMYCCHDYYHKSGLSSIREKSLIDIWNYEIYSEREKHIRNCIDKEPCKNCVAWQTMPKMYHSFPRQVLDVLLRRWLRQ